MSFYDLRLFATFFWDTPWKINMKAKNHPIEKENHLPNLHCWVPCWFSRVCKELLFKLVVPLDPNLGLQFFLVGGVDLRWLGEIQQDCRVKNAVCGRRLVLFFDGKIHWFCSNMMQTYGASGCNERKLVTSYLFWSSLEHESWVSWKIVFPQLEFASLMCHKISHSFGTPLKFNIASKSWSLDIGRRWKTTSPVPFQGLNGLKTSEVLFYRSHSTAMLVSFSDAEASVSSVFQQHECNLSTHGTVFKNWMVTWVPQNG